MRYFHIFLLAVGGMSVLSFLLFGIDKFLAVKHLRRIRERTLILSMWLCGALGGLFGMLLFRHKTLHVYFWVHGILALMVHMAAAFGIVYHFGV